MARMTSAERYELVVDAAVDVMLRKGMAATTVREVAAAMGTSSGLIHHYVTSMDDLLAAAFDRAAGHDLQATRDAMAGGDSPVARLRLFFATYVRADKDWAFQLWLDAWAEASRRPAVQQTSSRLTLAWQRLLEETIRDGVAQRLMVTEDATGAAWRILSLLDGLTLQAVAHRVDIDRDTVVAWSAGLAESELGLAAGSLRNDSGPSQRAVGGRPTR